MTWSANFSQNVCKELVHKFFNSEVFLTDSHKISNNSFLVSAFLPQTHIYYNDIPDNLTHKHDVSLLLEVFRQTSIYAAHTFCGVSIDSKFIFESANFKIFDNQNLLRSTKDYQAIISVKILEERSKKNVLYDLVLEMIKQNKFYGIMGLSYTDPKISPLPDFRSYNESYSFLDFTCCICRA